MAGLVLVVRIPGAPFTLRDLGHDNLLRATAQRAIDSGRLASVQDLGSLQSFELLNSHEARDLAHGWASSVTPTLLRQVACSTYDELELIVPQSLKRYQSAIFEALGERLVARTEPEAVVFHVAAKKDLTPAVLAATRISALRPRTQLFAFGPVFTPESVSSKYLKLFKAIGLGDSIPIDRILDAHDHREWERLPSLAYLNGARMILTGNQPYETENQTLAPASDNFLYTLPAEYDKIGVFDVMAVAPREGFAEVESVWEDRGAETASTVSGLSSIAERFGSRAFHFQGVEHTRDAALERRLLASGLGATFACSLDPARTQKTRMGLMSSAGCAAADVSLSTGSQRLLDTYYRRDFTITDAERLMRASRFAGIYTVAHFTYPCPEDDFHTEDETLRLIRRANPSSVVISTNVATSSHSLIAQEFGPFRRVLRARATKKAEALREKVRELGVPLDVDAHAALLAGLAGYRGREVEFAELAGLQLLSGDATGLAETIERINTAAARPARMSAFRPFTAEGNAVAN